jgi:Domain of unknown function (DUF222)
MFDADLHPLDAAHAAIGAAHATFLERVREADRSERWRREGARDLAHWLSMRYGMSAWKAHRWIGAAHALERLPLLKDALARGGLGIDKVVELCRFATPETESRLIVWAEGVSSGAVRRRADREVRSSIKQVREAERDRTLEWWYSDEGRRFGLFAEMPASYGPTVIRALEREAERIPVMPGEEDAIFASARRVDALVALCSGRLAADAQPARSTVVVKRSRICGGTPVRARQTTGRCSIRRPFVACSVRRTSRRSSRTMPRTSSASVGCPGSPPPGWCDRFATAIANAGSPVAVPGASPKRTTSGGGDTVGAPR